MPPENMPLRALLRCVIEQQTELTQKLEIILNGRDWRETRPFRLLEAHLAAADPSPARMLDLLVEASQMTSVALTEDERAHLARWPASQYAGIAGTIALAIRGDQAIELSWTLSTAAEPQFTPEIDGSTVRLAFLTPIALLRSETIVSVG